MRDEACRGSFGKGSGRRAGHFDTFRAIPELLEELISFYSDAPAAITIDLLTPANNTGDAKGDTFTSIERFDLSQYDDRFVGASAGEFIYGNAGNDTLLGGDGLIG